MPILTVSDEYAGVRADSFLSYSLKITRAAAQKILESGLATRKGEALVKSDRVALGEEIEYTLPELKPAAAQAENIPLDIIYEDSHLLIVNKPKGMVVHPAPGNHEGTLVNALLAHCGTSLSGIGGVIRPGIVHRIDKDTSGLLLIAKDDLSHNSLAAQIKEHSLTREYEAIVVGRLPQQEGTINKPIGRSPRNRKKMAVTSVGAKNAVTHFKVLEEFPGYTYVRFRLETGRTHQIRVHMSSIGHPVLGDKLYGGARKEFDLVGQTLHAKTIGFIHPETGEYMEFSSELPEYFRNLLAQLRKTV